VQPAVKPQKRPLPTLTDHKKRWSAPRLVVRIQESQAAIQESQAATLRDLAAAQKKTDASLKALIDQMCRSGGNGHAKGKVGMQ
jgi:hypothetical protein